MPLPRQVYQETSLEEKFQDLPPGSDPQDALSGITEEPSSVQGIEVKSDNPIPSTVEEDNHLGRSHQVRHYNSVQNPTEVNLDKRTLALPSG